MTIDGCVQSYSYKEQGIVALFSLMSEGGYLKLTSFDIIWYPQFYFYLFSINDKSGLFVALFHLKCFFILYVSDPGGTRVGGRAGGNDGSERKDQPQDGGPSTLQH